MRLLRPHPRGDNRDGTIFTYHKFSVAPGELPFRLRSAATQLFTIATTSSRHPSISRGTARQSPAGIARNHLPGLPQMGAKISNWSLSRDCGHMFVKIPPQFSVADFVRQAKGRSSRKIQQEFENMRKRYSEQRF
ncbi:transposase [Altererythrobacter sp. N1]|nr:transposase [Altererythrobacter sp. N1]